MRKFEWDSQKENLNLKKHGISFSVAATVFDDPYAIISFDEKHSEKELREWILGESDDGVLVVIFTKRIINKIRLISARKANKKERKFYEESKTVPF